MFKTNLSTELQTLDDIKKRILTELHHIVRTAYFTVYSTSGQEINIRVSDHCCNKKNNSEVKTLSFITQRTEQRRSGYNSIVEEWEVDLESELTDTFQDINQILEWEYVSDNQKESKELYYQKLSNI